MSVVCILTPVVIGSWPVISAAVTAAAASLGYTIAEEAVHSVSQTAEQTPTTEVNLELEQSEVVTDQLERDQTISVSRQGVTVTFSRDARGRASLCVSGKGLSKNELTARGEELSQRVVQQYVYQKLITEMEKRQFLVVENETDEHNAIRLKIRHWEG